MSLPKSRWGRIPFGGVAVLLGAALVLSACGDDDDDDTGSGSSSAPQPTGPPINLGFVNIENSPAGNYPEHREGAEAAIKYINEELGGVKGRPLNVETCFTDGGPESSIGCANKFIQGKKTAVMLGLDFGAPASMPLYTQANIPYLGGLASSAEQYTGPTAFSYIGGAPSSLAGIAAYAGQTLKAKKVSVLSPDVPAAHTAVDGFMRPVFAKAGVTEVEVVYESGTAADLTPALTRVNSNNPDVVVSLIGGAGCAASMRAVNSLGIDTAKVIYAQECGAIEQIEAGSGGGEGAAYQTAFLSPDADDPNVKIYRDAMAKYSPDFVGFSSESGFNTVMNTYAILTKLEPNNITSEAIIAALKATNNEPGFLSHPFTCNGTQFPPLTALCDTHVRFLKFENGEFTDPTNEWVSGASVLLGG